jgi:hypothetical protein
VDRQLIGVRVEAIERDIKDPRAEIGLDQLRDKF